MGVTWQFVVVAALASFVGLSELVSRYRSDPGYVLRHSLAAWLYVIVNGSAGVAALALIRAFGWFAESPHVDLWRVLIASFGAIAFFRSSLFVAKIGSSSIGVGPSLVLGALLDACDREVDRQSAEKISEVVEEERLDGLDPAQVMLALPVLCLALMQNFAPGDQAQLGAEISKVRGDTTLSEDAKMRAVLIQLSKHLGVELVTKVLTTTRAILTAPVVSPPVLPDAEALIEEAKKQISK